MVDSMAVESSLIVTATPPRAGPPTDWVKYIRVVNFCSPNCPMGPPSSFMELCCSRA